MPTITMTAVQPTGIGSPAFINDADGSDCVQFGTDRPSSYDILNLSGGFYNISDRWHNAACANVTFFGQFTIGPTNPITRSFNASDPTLTGFGLSAHDISGTARVRLTWVSSVSAPCVYGTRVKAGIPILAPITADLIASVLLPLEATFLAPVLGALVGLYIEFGDLCSRPPPVMPNISTSTPQESLQTWLNILAALAWPFGCECVPGTPAAVPYPIPAPTQPTGWPVFPTFTCDPDDVCATLVRLESAVAQLSKSQAQMYQFEQLMQRYMLPFAYVRGQRFSALAGSGSRAIARSVGLLLEVTAFPASNVQILGAPPYIMDLGWVSVLTADGMLDEIRLTRQATSWLSKLIPTAVSVGYALRDGVTLDITELLAEP